jgi:Late competence development protein ComFB
MNEPIYQANSYKNVMELLVDEEIDRQTCSYSKQDAQAINRIEVAACALNALTPLYASSQEGVSLQYERGLQEMSHLIAGAVLSALTTVAKKPQRESTPFSIPELEEISTESSALHAESIGG